MSKEREPRKLRDFKRDCKQIKKRGSPLPLTKIQDEQARALGYLDYDALRSVYTTEHNDA